MNLSDLKRLVAEAETACLEKGVSPDELPVYIAMENGDGELLPFCLPDEEISGFQTFGEPCKEDGTPLSDPTEFDDLSDIDMFVLANYKYETSE